MTGADKEDVIDLGTCTAENMKKILPNLTPEALAEGGSLLADPKYLDEPESPPPSGPLARMASDILRLARFWWRF